VGVDGVQRHRQFAGDLRPGQVGRQVTQHPQLARAELLGGRRRARGIGRRQRAAQHAEDVGAERGLRGLVGRQLLEQIARAGHRERQDQPVSPGQGQRALGGLARRALITERAVGEPS
jgi:hypothetical protein